MNVACMLWVFLIGQYQFAERILNGNHLEAMLDHSSRHRRDVLRKNDSVRGKARSPKLVFPSEYHVTGVLKLPYGSIEEPFESWYSGEQKMSRIDYYGGMDRTYQREDIGDYGFAAKIVPEYSEEDGKTFQGCLHHVGTKRSPVRAQRIVPSPVYFQFKGPCKLQGSIECWKWVHSFTILTKRNTYTLYTTRSRPAIPLRYEMMGYDTLLTSYYDHYILEYKNFSTWTYNFETFEIPSDMHCFDFEPPGTRQEVLTSAHDPMQEFMPHQLFSDEKDAESSALSSDSSDPKHDTADDSMSSTTSSYTDPVDVAEAELRVYADGDEKKQDIHEHFAKNHFELVVESLFDNFKSVFSKSYKTSHEHVKRKDLFRHNMRYINSLNRQHLGYRLRINHFADMTDGEMDDNKGLLNETGTFHDEAALPLWAPALDTSITPIPKQLDWREYGAVAEVRSQGICGSCYAYAVTGAIEGAHYLKNGVLPDLSEQQIVDCSWGFGNKGCKGGYPYRALNWIIKHGGVATEKSYGPYLAQEGYCHFENTTVGASVTSYFNVSTGNATALKIAMALYGPVTVLINTRPKTFKFYSEGLYYDSDCDSKLDHAALAVGYGAEKGHEYWIVKNSWSSTWGSKGFIKIAAKNDNCGVTQKAVVVKVSN